ncbi:MAG: hypothetical protein ACK8QZ_05110 [Anaerolineales bacterium]
MALEQLFYPNVLGTAIGAATAVAVLGFMFTALVNSRLKSSWAFSVGFILAGLAGTLIGAFGFADGGEPAWFQSAATYGFPAATLALMGVLWSLLSKENKSPDSTGRVLFAIPVLAVSALVGARAALIDEHYASGRFLNDPMAVGFNAIREEYPLLWSQFEQELRGHEIVGGSEPEMLAVRFFQENLPHLIKLGSDEAVLEFDRTLMGKLKYLSGRDPFACLAFASGTPPQGYSKFLSDEVKFAEGRALENLVRSSRKGNSGVAHQDEAEGMFISALVNLARYNPEGFYAYSEAASNGPPFSTPKIACDGFIALNEFMLQHSAAEYARYRRSELANSANPEFSEAANEEIALIFLYADATSLQHTLPQQIDEVTIMTMAEFDGRTFVYRYDLNTHIRDEAEFRERMTNSIGPLVCSDAEMLLTINAGAVVAYVYTDQNGEDVELRFNSSACAQAEN